MIVVVADATPLLYLSRIRALDVLPGLYGTVLVPQTVWNELVEARPEAPEVQEL